MLRPASLLVLGCVLLGGAWSLTAEQPASADARQAARNAEAYGNFREAFELFEKLCLNPDNATAEAASDLERAVQCLNRLQRLHDVDAFLEAVAAKHAEHWRVLAAVAKQYGAIDHRGYLIAGKFHRGYAHQGGEFVTADERDFVRGLQLFEAARKLIASESNAIDVAAFFRDYGHFIFRMRQGESWRLQVLTDASTLPDYEPSQRWGRRGRFGSGGQKGAPVDADGNPVFYSVPQSFEISKNDGERWRHCLEQAAAKNPDLRPEVDWEFTQFLHQQFGVQTLQQGGFRLPTPEDGASGDPRANIWTLKTLSDDETICRLATGLKRLTLPAEFNPLARLKTILDSSNRQYAAQASDLIASVYEDRQQYVKAATAWKAGLARFGDEKKTRQARIDQIEKPWGEFESTSTQPAGQGATLDFKFRNGKKLSLEAWPIRIDLLLADMKAHLKSNPRNVNWQQVQLEQIGYRLVQENQIRYLAPRSAQWTIELEPRAEHFDRRTTVATPLQQAGAYLVTAKLDGGNTSRIVVWVADTAIVKKAVNQGAWYYLADAVSGDPIPNVDVEFFGWRQEYREQGKRHDVLTRNFAEKTDANGQIVPDAKLQEDRYQWMAIAKTGQRLAFLGFSGVWRNSYQLDSLNQTKIVLITDRPVYRPDQKVEFKFWVRPVSYDLSPEQSKVFANQKFTVQLTDPMGVEVWTKPFTADEFGGFNGEHLLPKDAKLGSYSLNIVNHRSIGGGGQFRVEEYKKPEFMVEVDAPREPVALGDKVTATITAKYLFGAPVTNATVKYKVERTSYTERWFPRGEWDWLYGPGYWWFASNDTWYPGFARWGCFAPRPSWIDWNPDPPELVLDAEAPIGADGTVKIEIDTSLAKVLHGDEDHSYKITAEVVDASRRTIVGGGNVLVAREPFKVFVWLNRGHYRAGDVIKASAQVRTLDGKPVTGKGKLTLLKVSYDKDGKPEEQNVGEWAVDPNAQGEVSQELKAADAGQYRVAYTLTHTAEGKEPVTKEGAYLFVVRGENFSGSDFRFSDLELVPDKKEYAPGETMQLLVNTDRLKSTVMLFVRPVNGVCKDKPQFLKLDGKSTTVPIGVAQADMPNFFIEAVTVANGQVHAITKEIVVPPVKRVLNVDVKPSSEKYKPGQKAEVEVKLTELNGEPFQGSVVMSIYDKAVEYISGGSNVPDLKEHFWKWRRSHHPSTEHSLARWGSNLLKNGEVAMRDLGAFGGMVADLETDLYFAGGSGRGAGGAMTKSMARGRMMLGDAMPLPASAPMEAAGATLDFAAVGEGAGGGGELVQPTVRTQFADTAFWKGDITTDAKGIAKIDLTMPENLTGWKIRTWAMGEGTRVGEATQEVTTSKDLLVRLQAPRFFVEKDQVVLSAIVHNYLPHEKECQVVLELEGDTLAPEIEGAGNTDAIRGLTPPARQVKIPANGEMRVDWLVKAIKEGEAKVTMKALTDEESDAMQMTFPVYVHGMLKTESFSGEVRANENAGKITINVPAERRPEETRLEVRYSPTLAGAMVDALPYLVDYPYGCTEQTLNRFLPTVITQNVLKSMKLDLAKIRDKRTNLNPQEIGDDAARAADWARVTKNWHREMKNPVFDEAEVERMVKTGVADLTSMQLSDGGWGWFSGFGERSWPHTTCVVVHGLQIAQQNGVAIVPETLSKGVDWLKRHQDEQVRLLQIGEKVEKQEVKPEPGLRYRTQADNVDAFIYMVLVDADVANAEMQRFLYRDRTKLSLYSLGMFGLALHKQQQIEQRDMVIRNIDQFVVTDNENQTAYIDLPNRDSYWWFWYGDTIEANAYYLKLLTKVNPQDPKAAGLVKYLLNNRRHATYWNSTRDTAVCIEAMAEYLQASGESEPNMLGEVWIDGEKKQSVEITPEVLFGFNNKFVMLGTELKDGEHVVELRKLPLRPSEPEASAPGAKTTPLYFNAYLTNFTLEDPIKATGLEIKVGRKFYRLNQRKDAKDTVQGSRGQAVDQQTLKYDREELADLAQVTSGDLLEVELEIDSKNDYEYVIFEDLKAAGVEAVDLQSGYTSGGLGAYVEYRDERVAFFLRTLSRGKHSVSYRVRAEIPGQFSALPTRASAMYAPELKANADEYKLRIADKEE